MALIELVDYNTAGYSPKGATASKKKSTRRGRGGKKAEQATTEAPKTEEQNP